MNIVDLNPIDGSEDNPIRARRPSMHRSEMEKLRRLVERPFGELLFASLVVIGDGATERALLPRLIREAHPTRSHAVCVVDPGSMGSEHAVAVLKFAKLIGIPWILFCDSDNAGRTAVNSLVRDHGDGASDQVIWVSSEVKSEDDKGGSVESMLIAFDAEVCEEACEVFGYERDGDANGLLKFMKAHKGVIGPVLADRLIALHPWDPRAMDCWPEALVSLMLLLDELLPKEPFNG